MDDNNGGFEFLQSMKRSDGDFMRSIEHQIKSMEHAIQELTDLRQIIEQQFTSTNPEHQAQASLMSGALADIQDAFEETKASKKIDTFHSAIQSLTDSMQNFSQLLTAPEQLDANQTILQQCPSMVNKLQEIAQVAVELSQTIASQKELEITASEDMVAITNKTGECAQKGGEEIQQRVSSSSRLT